jgi:hypothetical protein
MSKPIAGKPLPTPVNDFGGPLGEPMIVVEPHSCRPKWRSFPGRGRFTSWWWRTASEPPTPGPERPRRQS